MFEVKIKAFLVISLLKVEKLSLEIESYSARGRQN